MAKKSKSKSRGNKNNVKRVGGQNVHAAHDQIERQMNAPLPPPTETTIPPSSPMNATTMPPEAPMAPQGTPPDSQY